jgi:hypothetical protein
MNKQTIKDVLMDWQNGLTHKEIRDKYKLSDFEEFAITQCSGSLTPEQILSGLKKLREGDKSQQIIAIMKGEASEPSA